MQRNLVSLAVLVAVMGGAAIFSGAAEAGKPGPIAVPAPVLLYINKSGAVEVSNADGSAAAVAIPAGDIHRPNWSPLSQNDMSVTSPAKIIFERPICQLHEIDVWVEDNVVKTGTVRDLPIALEGQDNACAADLFGDKLVSGESHTSTPTSDLFTMIRGNDGVWLNPVAILSLPYANITSENTITWASFSSDGKYIAFVESHRATAEVAGFQRINIIDREIPSSIWTVLDDPNQNPTLLEWSPTGNTLAFESAFAVQIMDINYDRGTNMWTGTPPIKIAASAGSPTWSNTSQQIYLTASGGVSVITKAPVTGTWGNLKLLVRFAGRPRYRN